MSEDVQLVQQCLSGDEPVDARVSQQVSGIGVFTLPSNARASRRRGRRRAGLAGSSFSGTSKNGINKGRSIPWLLTIAANRCRTALEKRSKLPSQNDMAIDLASERREHSKNAQEQLDIGEELELALGELRDDYRTCFVMYHQEELSYQEIGEVLGCPQGTIKTWAAQNTCSVGETAAGPWRRGRTRRCWKQRELQRRQDKIDLRKSS